MKGLLELLQFRSHRPRSNPILIVLLAGEQTLVIAGYSLSILRLRSKGSRIKSFSRRILIAHKLERELKFDEAGGGAWSNFCSRSNSRPARMRKSSLYANACYAG